MSLWFADVEEVQETEPLDGYYYGIFNENPAVIAAKLSRPPAPDVSHSDIPSNMQALSCMASMLPTLGFVPGGPQCAEVLVS
jgi:hypothetical protein